MLTVAVGTSQPIDRRERLAALFDAHEDRLYRLARRLSASTDEANDLVPGDVLEGGQISENRAGWSV